MFCPIFTAASIAHQGRGDKIIDQCEEKECAWWDETHSCCAERTKRVQLERIADALKEMGKKMPHEEQFRK